MAFDAPTAATAIATEIATVDASSSKEELPPLQPIQMKAAEGSEDKENEMVTPKSENCILKQPTICPPAPRKPQLARRKPLGELSANGYYAVPQDLSSTFVKRPKDSPPKKRIRLL